MPQRITGVLTIVLGLAGVLAVGVLIALRIDARRAAATGPKWKRRLVAAGLALLALTGASPAGGKDVGAASQPTCYKPAPMSRPAAVNLADKPEWQRLCQTWAQAQDVASDALGPYPFDAAGQKKLLDALAAGEKDVAALLTAGAVSRAEADLLTADLKALAQRVGEYRPTERKEVICYQARSLAWIAQGRVKDVQGRLDLLEKLSGQATLQPGVVYKVLAGVERQLAVVTPEAIKAMDEAERTPAQETRQTAEAKMAAIRAKIAGSFTAPEQTPQWATISETWKFVSPLAQSHQSTQAQRGEVDAKLAAARDAAIWLGAAGLLATSETELLLKEADRLSREIYLNPPTDSTARCYKMMVLTPARGSMMRVTQRLPLLADLAGSDKVHKGVLERTVPAIEADLATLSDAKQTAALTADERTQAAALAKQAAEDLAKIKKQMAEAK
ncbi:MAG: hypothetical protein NTV86_19185 [Planctomycetota bacterium]|nr:hypothetical protein [Planctomycetota bacterium]